eukprot:6212405-Pleurochrysis_carterae.AAC.2
MQWMLPLRPAMLQGVVLSPRDEHKKALLKEASKHQVDASERSSVFYGVRTCWDWAVLCSLLLFVQSCALCAGHALLPCVLITCYVCEKCPNAVEFVGATNEATESLITWARNIHQAAEGPWAERAEQAAPTAPHPTSSESPVRR